VPPTLLVRRIMETTNLVGIVFESIGSRLRFVIIVSVITGTGSGLSGRWAGRVIASRSLVSSVTNRAPLTKPTQASR
jgi:hypothetical protein